MLRRAAWWAAFSVLACILLLVGASFFGSCIENARKYNPTQNNAGQEYQADGERILFAAACAASNIGDFLKEHATVIAAVISAFATIAIAAFTYILYRATSALGEAGDKQIAVAQAAANAANRSAEVAERALIQLEAPILFITIEDDAIIVNRLPQMSLAAGVLKYRFANYGRTPTCLTTLTDNIIGIEVGKGFPPPLDAFSKGRQNLGWGVVVHPNGKSVELQINLMPLRMDETGAEWFFFPEKYRIFLQIRATYSDIFYASYTTGFLFMYDTHSERFILTSAGHDHNYRRRDEDPGDA